MNIIDLAKYIISKCYIEGQSINIINLQKALFQIDKKIPLDCTFVKLNCGIIKIPVVTNRFSGYGTMGIERDYGFENLFAELQKHYSLQNIIIIDSLIEKAKYYMPWDCVE